MNIGFIPPALLGICMPVVKEYYNKNAYDNLAAKISTPDNIAALTAIPGAFAVLKAANRYYQIRKWCFFASIGIACLSMFVLWWSLFALVVIFLADKVLARREKDEWKLLSSVLLSLEMLTNDFAGWGKAHPQERTEALGVLKDNPESPRSAWIDYYLPKRSGIDPSLLKAYGPPATEKS